MKDAIKCVPDIRGGYFKNVDILKGIGIILMVLGHSGFPFTHFIYLFHMATFFMASGYCWNRKNSDTLKDVINYIFRKIRTLYIPYVVCNLAFLILNNLFIDIGIYSDNQEFLILAGGDYLYSLREYLNIGTFVRQLILIVLFYGRTQLGGATWFLRSLFFVSVGHCMYEFIIAKINLKFRPVFIGGVTCLCCLIYEMHRIGVFTATNTVVLPIILGYMVYVIGILLKYLNNCQLRTDGRIAAMALVVLLLCNQFGDISISTGYVTNSVYYMVVSFCGWCMVMFISEQIGKTKISTFLVYLGKHTMPIILLHFLSFKIVTFFYLVISGNEMILLAYFPSLTFERWLWIFYVLIGVLVPLLIYRSYEIIKMKVLRQRT